MSNDYSFAPADDEDYDEPDNKSEHKASLREMFRPLVDVSALSASEQQLLAKYGAWLEKLMIGYLRPLSEAQLRFSQVCTGALAAETAFELAWGKYLKLVPGDYRFGLEARGMLDRAPRDSYKETRKLRTYLARKGHQQSIDWLQAEGPWEDLPSIGKGASSWEKGATYGASTMYSGGGNLLNPNT